MGYQKKIPEPSFNKTNKLKPSSPAGDNISNHPLDLGQLLNQLKNNDIIYLKILLFGFPFLYGLFADFTALLAGVLLSVYLFFLIIRRQQFRFSTSLTSLLLIFVFFSYLITAIWAVDYGMALIGFMKFSPGIIFLYILMQFTRAEISSCFSVLPWSGITMVMVTALTWFFPDLAVNFYDGGRLGGFFQYANTFALFLLIGIVVIFYHPDHCHTSSKFFKLSILMLGILLSGSRISFLMLLGLLIYLFFQFKFERKIIVILAGSLLIIIAMIVLITGNLDNVGRITTVFTASSTLLGRLLYAVDALQILIAHPFGIGYMGFYYLQDQLQTGVYSVRFVHNEFLQMALDAGLLAALCFCFVCFKSLFSPKTEKMERIIMLTILFHAFFDFDFQYLVILFILLMTLDLGESRIFKRRSLLMVTQAGLILLSLFYGYASIGLYLGHRGDYQTSLKYIPFNTDLKIQILSTAQTPDEIIYWADSILSANQTVALAYEGKAVVAGQTGNYEEMVTNMQQVVMNSKYNINKYEEYLIVLEKAMQHYNALRDRENLIKYADLALAIPDQLDQVAAATNPLAYMIVDQPVLRLSFESQRYLVELRELINHIR